jgi:hypothetical protein
MGRFLMKLPDERFVEWSTVVDAPVTYSMTEAELTAWHLEEFGRREHEQNFQDRLDRLKKFGTSLKLPESAADAAIANRAGEGEAEISLSEIAMRYHPNNADKKEGA